MNLNYINKWLLGTASLFISHVIIKSNNEIQKTIQNTIQQPLIIIMSAIFITTQDIKISITLTLLYHLYNNTKLSSLPLLSINPQKIPKEIPDEITEENPEENNDTESNNSEY